MQTLGILTIQLRTCRDSSYVGGNRSDTKGSCRLHTPFSHVSAHTRACVQLTPEQHGLQPHRSTYRWVALTRRVGQDHVICGGLNLRMQNVGTESGPYVTLRSIPWKETGCTQVKQQDHKIRGVMIQGKSGRRLRRYE